MGLGDRNPRTSPFLIEALWALPVKQLAAGDYHSCALTRSGYLFTWGLNQQGQLGQPPDAEHAAIQTTSRGGSSRRRMSRRVNQKYLSALMDMGIPKEKAELALIETKNHGVEVATEWLFSAPESSTEQVPQQELSQQLEERRHEVIDDKSVLVPRRVPLKVCLNPRSSFEFVLECAVYCIRELPLCCDHATCCF